MLTFAPKGIHQSSLEIRIFIKILENNIENIEKEGKHNWNPDLSVIFNVLS